MKTLIQNVKNIRLSIPATVHTDNSRFRGRFATDTTSVKLQLHSIGWFFVLINTDGELPNNIAAAIFQPAILGTNIVFD